MYALLDKDERGASFFFPRGERKEKGREGKEWIHANSRIDAGRGKVSKLEVSVAIRRDPFSISTFTGEVCILCSRDESFFTVERVFRAASIDGNLVEESFTKRRFRRIVSRNG